jgi:GNAT superfamily N-acetyltransferase
VSGASGAEARVAEVSAEVAVLVRLATVGDAIHVARHRAAMFRDMGVLSDGPVHDALVAATLAYLERAMPAGEYHGWLAEPAGAPGHVVAGAGVQLRPIVPRPDPFRPDVLAAPQALLLNVYTEPAWRRRGIAERLVRAAVAWAAERGASGVVLHAAAEGRALYERLGFEATNEMRYAADLQTRTT